jgi:hypothetical protein
VPQTSVLQTKGMRNREVNGTSDGMLSGHQRN